MLFLEDLNPGREFDVGSVTIDKDKMVAFAKEFDPQIFHIDEAVATQMFGGLIASGNYTSSLLNRLAVDGFLGKIACMASPGLDEVRFLKPVFAGDTLSGLITVIESKVSSSKPDRGLLKAKWK